MSRALPYVLFVLTVIVGAAAVVVDIQRRGIDFSSRSGTQSVNVIAIAFVCSGVGLLVARARPRNVVGWILLGSGLGWAIWGALIDYVRAVLLDGTADVLGAALLLAWIGRWAWVPVVMPTVLFAPMFFPDGRLLSARWWPLPVAGLAGAVASVVGTALNPGEDQNSVVPGIVNPYGVDAPWVSLLQYAGFVTMLLALTATAASLVIRMRRGNALERQQLKIFFFAALLWPSLIAAAAIEALTGWQPPDFSLVGILGLPVSIGIAILRYRLYDIDVLIRRTLIYAALSAVLVIAYVAGIALFQLVLAPFTSGNGIAVAVSTLVVVALFQPVRGRIQRAVDRRFYRSKYDAERTLDAFAARLREQIDLGALERELLAVVDDTLQPARASVWLRPAR